jgi:hypothetical protein
MLDSYTSMSVSNKHERKCSDIKNFPFSKTDSKEKDKIME